MFIWSSLENHPMITHDVVASPKSENFSRHFHASHEILLHIRGDADYSIDGNRFPLKKYDLLFIPSSTYHFAIPLSDAPYENYVINIDPKFEDEALLKKLFSPPYSTNIRDDARIKSMFFMFDYYYDNYSRNDFFKASEMLIHELLIYSGYNAKSGGPNPENDLIAQITSFISRNLESELNAKTIAAELNFSSSYIQNLFSSVMGIGLMHYINQKKIFAAHNDIEEGLSPIEASAKYRYNNYSSFFRQYVKCFGYSPKQSKK